MSLNPLKLMQLKNAWQSFARRHPKFPLFWKAVYKQGLVDGTVLEFKVSAITSQCLRQESGNGWNIGDCCQYDDRSHDHRHNSFGDLRDIYFFSIF